MNGPLDNENFYVIFYTFLTGVIAGTKYNRGLQAHKLMLEALSTIHWRQFASWFSSEHADKMETLKKLEDSLEQLYDRWKSQCNEDVLKQGVSVCISHGFMALIFTSANLDCLLLNIYNEKKFTKRTHSKQKKMKFLYVVYKQFFFR